MKNDKQRQVHNIEPVFDENSKVLILGSFPSVMSREQKFFYGHKNNRFWQVVSSVFECVLPTTIDEKKSFLLANHIALWDTIASCDIIGSADSTIKNVIPNDIKKILSSANIKMIFTNGKTSFNLYNQYLKDKVNREATCLPSTSSANASKKLNDLIEVWKIIKLAE